MLLSSNEPGVDKSPKVSLYFGTCWSMEENQTETGEQRDQSVRGTQPVARSVSFPTVGPSEKSGKGKTLLVLGVLALVGVLGYLVYRSASTRSPQPSPTSLATLPAVETPSPTATAMAKPVDKNKVKIQVLNGTGIPGEAAYVQTQLKNLGYTNITLGNATVQNATVTVVTFSKSLAQELVDEITKKLKNIYDEVEVKTSSSASADVLVVTGLRKGTTAKPSATATPKATLSPTSTASPSATPTST